MAQHEEAYRVMEEKHHSQMTAAKEAHVLAQNEMETRHGTLKNRVKFKN